MSATTVMQRRSYSAVMETSQTAWEAGSVNEGAGINLCDGALDYSVCKKRRTEGGLSGWPANQPMQKWV
jgi:hypothetical protein